MSLEQDVEELSTTVPSLPGAARGLAEDTQRLWATTSNLIGGLRAARTELSRSLTAAQEALPKLEGQMSSLRERLQTALERVESVWNAARDGLAGSQDQLETAADDVDMARLDLQRGVVDGGARVTNAGADGEAVSRQVQAAAKEGHLRAAAAAEAVSEHGEKLRSVIQGTHDPLQSAGDLLRQRLLGLATRVQGECAYLAGEELDNRITQDADHRRQAAEEIGARAADIMADIEARLQAGVAAAAAVATRQPLGAAEAVGAAAGEQATAVGEARKALLEGLGEVDEATAPLAGVFAQVDNTAALIRQP